MAVESTSIVPNQFFDLFARVIPGSVLIFMLELLDDRVVALLMSLLVPLSLRDNLVAWLVVLTAASYTIGHVLSPFVKLLERSGDIAREHGKTGKLRQVLEALNVARIEGKDDATLFEGVTDRYNALRFRYPARVIYATRIRAEATMYGGLAAALAVAALICLKRWILGMPVAPHIWVTGMFVFGCMLLRYFDLYKRFCKTIKAFEKKAAPQ